MGGYGSSRPGRKQKTENCRTLNVTALYRAGALEPGWSGNWRWLRDGVEVAQIGIAARDDRMVLNYRYRQSGGD